MTLALVVLLLLLVLANVPIAVALGLTAATAIVAASGFDALPNVALVMFSGATKFPLIAIPLFILAGTIMNASGISQRLVAFASAVVGFVRGGLAVVSIAASMFFAEISGSAVADVAAMGSILIPAMKKRGYSAEFAAAVTSSSATLAVIIPPSIPLILYGVMSGASVVELFVAGILPGAAGGLLMMLVAYLWARRANLRAEQAFQLRRLWETFKEAGWSLVLPVIILGGILSGWVTATEGAALAVVAALLVGGIAYRGLTRRKLAKAVVDAGSQTAVVMLLVASSALLGDYLTEVRAPQRIVEAIMGVTESRLAILALLNGFLLLLGLFLHSAAAIILVVPIAMPLVEAAGIDPVHFGMIVTLNLGVGQQTPPVASVLVTACSVAKTDVWGTTRTNLWFIAVLVAVLAAVTYVPAFSLSLVEAFYR